MNVGQDSALLARATAFILDEAHYLDEARYDDWLALWTSDGAYWMPCDPKETDRAFGSAIINDTLSQLRLRIARLSEPNAHAMVPAPRGCRIVANVRIIDIDPLRIRAKLVCHEFQRRQYGTDDQRVFCATLHYWLEESDAGFLIREKRVDLIDAIGARTVMPVPL